MVAVLLLPLISQSQQSMIKEILNKDTQIKSDESSSMNRIISANYGENIFFMSQTKYNSLKHRYIYKFNIKTGDSDSLKISYSKETKSFINERFFSIEVTDNKIIILTDENINILQYSNNKINSITSIKNKYFFSYIKKLNNNEFFLYVNYNFHPLDAPDRHVWAKLNLTTNNITDVKKMSEDNAIYSHFVNNWVSIYNGLIAYSNTTEYKITFYNSNFTKMDSLISDKLDSNKIYLNEVDSNNDYSKEGITNMMKKDEQSLKRIQKIFLLDSAHIMVMVKIPKTPKCEFDLWSKTNNNWSLNNTELISNFYESNKKYEQNNQLAEGFFGNVNGVLYNKNNEYNIIYFPFMENIITESFDYNIDYNDKINSLVKKQKLTYGIKKYKIYFK